ncbi:hypothetical protein [Desulfoluna sp.]|uniref:hypothetical protein n=1 Tax=Desulfoluna sp. TaxID=2045199 RepID=UPI002605898D|nr:hypothetical protein [Desulfoluna sp.]
MERQHFNKDELHLVARAVSVSEDLVSNDYKISESQWLRNRFDVKTGVNLTPEERIAQDVFAQVIRYRGRPSPNAGAPREFDLYMICLQDHTILKEVATNADVSFYPFLLYLFIHELVHIIRFGRFLQSFTIPDAKRDLEENLVHDRTREILASTRLSGVKNIIAQRWAIRHCNP